MPGQSHLNKGSGKIGSKTVGRSDGTTGRIGLGKSFLIIKGTLRKGVEQTFANVLANELPQIQPHFYETVDKGHGRIETRRHWMIDDEEIIKHLDPKGEWKGLRSIGMVQSERIIGQKVSKETRYYIISFKKEIKTFAGAVRSHWGIENKVLMSY